MHARYIAPLALLLAACAASTDGADEEKSSAAEAISTDGAITPKDASGYMERIKASWETLSLMSDATEVECARVVGWTSTFSRYYSDYGHECWKGYRVKGLRPKLDVIYVDFKAKTGEPSRHIFLNGTMILGEVWDGVEVFGPKRWFVREGSKMVPYEGPAEEVREKLSPREERARNVRASFLAEPDGNLVETTCMAAHGAPGKTAGATCYGNGLYVGGMPLVRIVSVPDGSDTKFVLVTESEGAIVEVRRTGGDFVFYYTDANNQWVKLAK